MLQIWALLLLLLLQPLALGQQRALLQQVSRLAGQSSACPPQLLQGDLLQLQQHLQLAQLEQAAL
jgi:hypothetical protein